MYFIQEHWRCRVNKITCWIFFKCFSCWGGSLDFYLQVRITRFIRNTKILCFIQQILPIHLPASHKDTIWQSWLMRIKTIYKPSKAPKKLCLNHFWWQKWTCEKLREQFWLWLPNKVLITCLKYSEYAIMWTRNG